MNPLILTIIIALATFILAVFGASWLSVQMLKHYIDARFDGMNARIDSVQTEVRAVRNEIAPRLDRIERQLDAIFKPNLSKTGD